MIKPGRLSMTDGLYVRRRLLAGLSFAALAMMGTVSASAQNGGPTQYYQGVAVIGDPVEINLNALDKLGPPPNLRQLLQQPAVVVGAGSPVTQRGAVLTGQPPVSGLTANAPQLLQPAPGSAPRSGLVPGTRLSPNTVAAAPTSGLEVAAPASVPRAAPAPATPRVAAPPPPQPAQPKPTAVAAAVPKAPEPAAAAVRPAAPPPPVPVAATPKPAPAQPKPAPAVAATPKPAPAPAKPKPVAVAAKPAPAPAPTLTPKPAPVAAKPTPVPAAPAITPPPTPVQAATASAPKVEIPKLEAPKVAEAPKVEANVPKPAATQASTQVAALNPNAVVENTDGLTIKFATDSSELPAGATPALDRIAERLNASSNTRVVLQGYARNDGETASQSRRLSLFRALSVRTYLIKQGIRSTRMDVRALGNKVENGEPNRVDVVIPQVSG